MNDDAPRQSPGSTDDRLDSWKEIAAFLKRDISTVQRWEKREGMPVHRHQHARSGSVFAYRAELDAWWRNGHTRVESAVVPPATLPARGRSPWVRRVAAGLGLLAVVGVVVATFHAGRVWTPTPLGRPEAGSPAKQNPEAEDLYLRGRLHCSRWTSEDFEKGVGHLERSLRLRPNHAPTFRALAGCYMTAAFFGHQPPRVLMQKRRHAMDEAVRVSGGAAEDHQFLATGAFYDAWDWTAAEREFRDALRLVPEHRHTRIVYSWYLAAMGRSAEAIAFAEEARRRDPLDIPAQLAMCSVAFFARQHDRAVNECRRAVDQEPANMVARAYLGWALLLQGSKGDALVQLETARTLAPDSPFAVTLLAHGLARAERRRDAQRMLAAIQAMSLRRYVSPYYLAFLHAALGEPDLALDRLEQAHAERSPWMVWLKVDQRLDPLRRDGRFQVLLGRMQFPEPAEPVPPGPLLREP